MPSCRETSLFETPEGRALVYPLGFAADIGNCANCARTKSCQLRGFPGPSNRRQRNANDDRKRNGYCTAIEKAIQPQGAHEGALPALSSDAEAPGCRPGAYPGT